MNYSFYPGHGIFFDLFSLLVNIFFWFFVVWAIVALVRAIFGGGNDDDQVEEEKPKKNKYVDIIKTRYAEGEITKKEFNQLMDDLS